MAQIGKPLNRLKEIDALRAVGIIVIMMTHVYSRHLDSAFNYAVWNNLHFVVVGFVFSSGYVLARKYSEFSGLNEILKWYKKRIPHLIVPYYIYLCSHYLLWTFFPHYFNGYDLKTDPKFIWKSLIFSGGAPLGWITLLFIQLTLLFPLMIWLMNKKKSLFIIWLIIAAFAGIFFTLYRDWHENFRRVMWVTWSLVFIFGAYMSVKERKSHNSTIKISFYFKWGTAALVIYALLWIFFDRQNIPHQLVDHKYPPNFFYLSYGMAAAMGLLAFMKITKIHLQTNVSRTLTYLSKNSYSLYFIHYIVLDLVLHKTQGTAAVYPLFQTILVVFGSLTALFFLNLLFKKTLAPGCDHRHAGGSKKYYN